MTGRGSGFREVMARLVRLAVVGVAVSALSLGAASAAAPAQAAVPDHWGFAYVNVLSGIPDPSHQAGSWPAPYKPRHLCGAITTFRPVR